jgi:DNA repair protein RadC
MKDNKDSGLHGEHRKRKKDFFIKSGIENMPEHEVLECFLFFSVPQKDTNETAHLIIEKFGSLKIALNADYKELLEVKGVGEHTASMFTFFKMLSAEYFKIDTAENFKLDSYDSVFNYVRAIFTNVKNEEMRCIFLNDDLTLIGNKKISDGMLDKVYVPFRTLVESVFDARCSRIILAHNHPNSICMPSKNDVDVTVELNKVCKKLDIQIVDHIITARDGEWSMKSHNFLFDDNIF